MVQFQFLPRAVMPSNRTRRPTRGVSVVLVTLEGWLEGGGPVGCGWRYGVDAGDLARDEGKSPSPAVFPRC